MCCDSGQDTSGMVAQAQASEKVGMRALDLTEQQNARSNDLQDEFLDIIAANAESDAELKDIQTELALEQAQRRRDIFDPLEARIVDEAENYDSLGRMTNEMGKADAAVVQAYDRAKEGSARDMLRLGINPNSGKALALQENSKLGLAKAAAEASTGAGERVKGKGFAMRLDAAGLGRNLATNQTAAADSALRAGNSVVGATQAGVDQGNRNFNSTMTGFGTASSAFGTAGNLYGKASEIEASNDPLGSIGGLVGYGVKTKMGTACA